MAFSVDWNEWRKEWNEWRQTYRLNTVRSPFPNKNMLADEVIGTYQVITVKGGKLVVELSEVTFPNLSDRDPQTGRLLDTRHRYVGLAWWKDGGIVNGGLAETFEELEQLLREGV